MADDKDLRSYASTPWRQMRPAAESVAEGDMVRQGSTVAVVLSGYAVVEAGRAVVDLAARRPLLLVGAAAATALALYWQRDRLAGLARTVKELAPDIVDTAVQHLESERAARVSLREAAHVAPAQDLLASVASALACAPGPLTRTELAHRLRDAHVAQTGHRRLMPSCTTSCTTRRSSTSPPRGAGNWAGATSAPSYTGRPHPRSEQSLTMGGWMMTMTKAVP